jgi:hypothetical protein
MWWSSYTTCLDVTGGAPLDLGHEGRLGPRCIGMYRVVPLSFLEVSWALPEVRRGFMRRSEIRRKSLLPISRSGWHRPRSSIAQWSDWLGSATITFGEGGESWHLAMRRGNRLESFR